MRDDKSIYDASSPDFLAGMWQKQERKGKYDTGADDGELVDVDIEAEAELDESDDAES